MILSKSLIIFPSNHFRTNTLFQIKKIFDTDSNTEFILFTQSHYIPSLYSTLVCISVSSCLCNLLWMSWKHVHAEQWQFRVQCSGCGNDFSSPQPVSSCSTSGNLYNKWHWYSSYLHTLCCVWSVCVTQAAGTHGTFHIWLSCKFWGCKFKCER